MKTVLALILIGFAATSFVMFSSSSNSLAEAQFQDFLQTYNVGYSNDYEYDYRLQVFTNNLKKIEELNARNPSATFGVNKFGDRTEEEMAEYFIPHQENSKCKKKMNYDDLKEIDWEEYLGDVFDQKA